jgi:hypothetical protein
VTVTVTVNPPVTVVTSTVTRVVTPTQSSTPTQPPPSATPNPSTEVETCYGSGLVVVGDNMAWAVNQFCSRYAGKQVSSTKLAAMILPLDNFFQIDVGVTARNNCAFTIQDSECRRILMKIADDCKSGLLRIGGYITDNCGQWFLDPNQS